MKTLLLFLGLALPALAQSISAQSLMNPLAFPSHDSPTISKIVIVGENAIFRQLPNGNRDAPTVDTLEMPARGIRNRAMPESTEWLYRCLTNRDQ
jgi:hypothetical protein